jgi:hypothetical protein
VTKVNHLVPAGEGSQSIAKFDIVKVLLVLFYAHIFKKEPEHLSYLSYTFFN